MSTVKEKKSLIEKCHLFASDSNGIRKWRKTEEKSFFFEWAFCFLWVCVCYESEKSFLVASVWVNRADNKKRVFLSPRKDAIEIIIMIRHRHRQTHGSSLFSPWAQPTAFYFIRLFATPWEKRVDIAFILFPSIQPSAPTLQLYHNKFLHLIAPLSLSLSLSSTDIVRIFNFSLHAEKQFVFSWANKSERPSTWWIWAESQLNFNRGKNKLSLFSSLEWDYADFLIQSGEMMTVMMMRGRQEGRVVGKIERKTRTQ